MHVRPYPTALLAVAREAIATGDPARLRELYARAARGLEELDPDEVAEWRERFQVRDDAGAAQAALGAAEDWEGIVVLGAAIGALRRFRGFAWLAAHVRFDLPGPRRFEHYARGGDLPGLSAEDSALYVAVPALVGLGPDEPDEVPAPAPAGEPVWRLLGLPEDDWEGVDPVDGLALTPEQCRDEALPIAWRAALARCEEGAVVRARD